MATFKDYSEKFKDSFLKARRGLEAIEKIKQKSVSDYAGNVAKSLLGLRMPSSNELIAEMKGRTYRLKGAENLNTESYKYLAEIKNKYLSLYNNYFKDLYDILNKIYNIKQNQEITFSSNQLIDEANELNIMLDTDIFGDEGTLSKNSPAKIIESILEKISLAISNLETTIKSETGTLDNISIDLDSDTLSDSLISPIENITESIYVFLSILNGIKEFKIDDSSSTTPGTPPGTPPVTPGAPAPGFAQYKVVRFLDSVSSGGVSSLTDTSSSGTEFKLDLLDPRGLYNVAILFERVDGAACQQSEADAINANKVNFLSSLLDNDVISVFDRSKFNLYARDLVASISGDNLVLLISLDENYKTEMYSSVPFGNTIISIQDIFSRSTQGSIVHANIFIDKIIKKSEAVTTSYYETTSPSGEKITFTPTDLVLNMGKLKDSSGKLFKPKKIKGKSLSERVNSKNFGKIKK